MRQWEFTTKCNHLIAIYTSPSLYFPVVLHVVSSAVQDLCFCSMLIQHLVHSTWHNGVLANDKSYEVL